MAIDKEASRRWRRRLREVLNEEWDPIGLRAGPDDDEYEAYAGKIAAMVREGASTMRCFNTFIGRRPNIWAFPEIRSVYGK